MIVSLDWLREYVSLGMSTDELTERLTLSGLNLEGVDTVGQDVAIDLEVTSNRPDCLGHLGVAREISVLWGTELRLPTVELQATGPDINRLTRVDLRCPSLCPRYTARVIQGVRIGPSPDWLANRLRSLGLAVINNVVDITNYVMMECGQPLHAFDFGRLAGQRIVVREALAGEPFTAIDHRTYELVGGMCVIADRDQPVALGGVMGGADCEVSESTTDLLIEAADFDPLSVRRTARQLNLQSPSSYRFERGVDPEGIDWASRRCCQLILELAGGTLAEGSIDAGERPRPRDPITLRLSQLQRILGIVVPPATVRKILSDLGNSEVEADDESVCVVPPSWRADLTREVDLIEEVARIHGYDKIPEDAGVRMAASSQSHDDRVLDQLRTVLLAAGCHEAITLSAVERAWVEAFAVWTEAPPLQTSTPVLRRADCLRQSLVPSLLATRRHNEKLSNPVIELFEIAHVYLPGEVTPAAGQGGLPQEKRLLGISSGGDFLYLKGVVESLVGRVARSAQLTAKPFSHTLVDSARSCQLMLGDELLGYLGELSAAGREQFALQQPGSVAEIDLGVLVSSAEGVVQAQALSPFPSIARDLNMVVDEEVSWQQVAQVTAATGGELIESIGYQDTYRDPQRLGKGKKSLLLTIQLRSSDATLTNQQADEVRDEIVAALGRAVGGQLR
jgi:phenylalanyl-tRNA synthetase beta chain